MGIVVVVVVVVVLVVAACVEARVYIEIVVIMFSVRGASSFSSQVIL